MTTTFCNCAGTEIDPGNDHQPGACGWGVDHDDPTAAELGVCHYCIGSCQPQPLRNKVDRCRAQLDASTGRKADEIARRLAAAMAQLVHVNTVYR